MKTASDRPVTDYSSWHDGTSRYELTHDGRDYRFYIPNNVMQLFDDEFDYRETANHNELTDYAVALFVGMMNVPAVPSGGGCGTSSDLPWGRKEDEDEMEHARRCAYAAIKRFGKKPKLSTGDRQRVMANKKFDYSNDMVQDNNPQNENESKEHLRRQHLEQRNNALANEFRDLKPEIGRAYNCLCNLVEKSGALSEIMLNLIDLLKTVLPVRLSNEDKKALQNELHGIADNVISKIRKVREKMENDIRKMDSRISLTPATFWCMVALLIFFLTFFAIVIFANMKLFL